MADAVRLGLMIGFAVLVLILPWAIRVALRPRHLVWLLISIYAVFAAGIQAMILDWGRPLHLVYLWRLLALVAGFTYCWKTRHPGTLG
jgi:hypothetical protein